MIRENTVISDYSVRAWPAASMGLQFIPALIEVRCEQLHLFGSIAEYRGFLRGQIEAIPKSEIQNPQSSS
jgi:hypothetical protein